MEKEPERNRFIYDDEDELEVYDMEDLEVVEDKKPIAASAILDFTIESKPSK